MTPSQNEYMRLAGSTENCMRTIGGLCVGNCRGPAAESCMRTIGGICVGNCRGPAADIVRTNATRPTVRFAS